MATKKQPKKAVVEPVEEIIETDEKLAEIEEITAETVVENEESNFINRKLKAINTWTNKAKQRRAIAELFKTKGRI